MNIRHLCDYVLNSIHECAISIFLAELGKHYRVLRKNRGLTQIDVAVLAGISRLQVIAVEAGKESVSIVIHAKLSSALGHELGLIPRRRPTLDEMKDFQ